MALNYGSKKDQPIKPYLKRVKYGI